MHFVPIARTRLDGAALRLHDTGMIVGFPATTRNTMAGLSRLLWAAARLIAPQPLWAQTPDDEIETIGERAELASRATNPGLSDSAAGIPPARAGKVRLWAAPEAAELHATAECARSSPHGA
jgi:hypothetical protein